MITVNLYKRTSTSSGDFYLCDLYNTVSRYELHNNGIILIHDKEDGNIKKTVIQFSREIDYKIEILESK